MTLEHIQIDLNSLQQIMDKISTDPADHTLTKEDILIIAQIVAAVGHQSCAFGFTNSEVNTVKNMVSGMNKGILFIGYSLIATIGACLAPFFYWVFKHGIIDIVSKGK